MLYEVITEAELTEKKRGESTPKVKGRGEGYGGRAKTEKKQPIRRIRGREFGNFLLQNAAILGYLFSAFHPFELDGSVRHDGRFKFFV